MTVNAIPTTPSITSNSPICEGATLTLSTSNVTGATYSWEGANNFIGVIRNPIINNATVAASGSYSLKIKVNGCLSSASAPLFIVVNPSPAAPTLGSNSPIEEGGSLNLTASNLTDASFLWSGPNSFTSILQNPTINDASPNMSGSYFATVTLNGCTSSNATPIVV